MGGGDGPAAPARSPEILAAVPWSADVGVALGSAVVAAGSATPFIMTVDKAVTLAAAGQMTLGKAVMNGLQDILLRPHRVLMGPAIWLVAGVYGATYTAANLIDVVAERKQATPTQHNTAKLFGTTAVNMSASLVKDVAFAKMFGKAEAAAVKRAVPFSTYGIFLGRDVFTIGAGFIVPPVLARGMVSTFDMEPTRADKVAQLVSPMGMQLICTPMHLLGLNMYNEPGIPMSQRAASVWRTCPESTGIRMLRFLFAYGFGGIVNKELTARGRAWNTERYVTNAAVQ